MVRFHGNWCGPGWTAGQAKDASELTEADRNVPAVDALDSACKDHDIGLHDTPENAKHHNRLFIARAKSLGIKGKVAAALVRVAGPKPAAARMPSSTPTMVGRRRHRDPEEDKEQDDVEAFLDANGDVVMDNAVALMPPPERGEIPWDGGRNIRRRTNIEGDFIRRNDAARGHGLMEIDQGGETRPGAEAARAIGGGGAAAGNNQVSKETPISPYPSLNYGLQETHTTILPWTGWVTACLLDKETPLQLKVRMNSPYDMLDMAIIADPAAGATYASKGFSQVLSGPDGKGSLGQITYPARFTASATEGTERPAWREYWAQLYQYYTVLATEWEFIIVNPCQPYDTQNVTGSLPILTSLSSVTDPTPDSSTLAYNDPAVKIPQRQIANAVAGIQYDSYSATATSTGNVMPLTYYEEVRNYKNIRWERIKDGNGTSIIKGTYRPGDIKRNIVNDGDVKTWSAVGASPTTLSEILTLNLWQDPLNNTDQNVSVNMEVNIKYIVQFKDLKLQARYPNTITAGQDITQSLSNAAITGNAYSRWA